MRMRGRRLLPIVLSLLIIVLLCFSYISNHLRDSSSSVPAASDEFLLQLPDDTTSAPRLRPPAGPLLNLTDFDYLLASDVCRRADKELLGHDSLRAAHRQAIAQSKLAEMGLQRVFLLAALPPSERFLTQAQVISEQARFGDLLQGNFVEDYRNLSYKHVMGLRWAAGECEGRTKFIIKLDDDIIYDVFHLRRYLESLEVGQPTLATSSTLLAGYVLDAKPPIRLQANKWYVTRQEYPHALYPAYLSGWLYITNVATATRLVAEAQRVPIFWIDDTWVTGVVRARLGIPLERHNDWYSANSEFLDCCVRDLKQHNFECEYSVGPNGGNDKLLVEFLHHVEKCYFDECTKRPAGKSLRDTCVAAATSRVPQHGLAQVKPLKLR
ncbi:beta-1,3-galactosyltransferase brn isoform X2 [Drosophila obscura]|uniref:beta-1,3-galactosyltransferase brn isoform X2 n=1 Tax=Drosophila obscura TaxID=7282 RepID=UPI001BB276D4|nr:beta-1,3-galactosyltransferase brn isoform X2 [Drosophila obscura]